MKNLKQISVWAADNRKNTRVIIAFLQIGLILLGLFYASILRKNEINIPNFFLFISAVILFISVVFYPYISLRKKKIPKLFKYSYKKQKVFDFIIAFNLFLIVVFAFGQNGQNSINIPFVSEVFAVERIQVETEMPAIQNNVSQYNIEEDDDPVKKKKKYSWKFILLSALVIGVAAWLGIGIALFACLLSCGGNTAGALLTLVLGGGLLVFGVSSLMRALIKRYLKSKSQRIEEKKNPSRTEPELKKNGKHIFLAVLFGIMFFYTLYFMTFIIAYFQSNLN